VRHYAHPVFWHRISLFAWPLSICFQHTVGWIYRCKTHWYRGPPVLTAAFEG
jgi:hypothetical protein